MALITLTGSQVFSGGVLIGSPANNNAKLTDIISLYGVSRAFSIILDPETGVLHVSGDNTYGQLGLQYANENEEAGITSNGTEDNPDYASWGLLDRDNNYFAGKAQKVLDISTGVKHALLLTSNGALYVMGSNRQGQLGYSDSRYNMVTTKETGGPLKRNVMRAWAGGYYSWVMDFDGNVWTAGANESGQVGFYGSSYRAVFTMQTNIIDVNPDKVSLGYYHGAYITNAGDLMVLGYNRYGQVGTVYPTGTASQNADPVLLDAGVDEVACGGAHTVYIKDGDLYALGHNYYGQLGDITAPTFLTHDATDTPVLVNTGATGTPVKVKCGSSHTLVLYDSGELWGFGYNGYEQMGVVSDTNDAGGETTILSPTLILSDVVDFDTSATHTIIRRQVGQEIEYVVAGDNRSSQLYDDPDVSTKKNLETLVL